MVIIVSETLLSVQVKRLYAFPSEDGATMPDTAPAVVAKVSSCDHAVVTPH